MFIFSTHNTHQIHKLFKESEQKLGIAINPPWANRLEGDANMKCILLSLFTISLTYWYVKLFFKKTKY